MKMIEIKRRFKDWLFKFFKEQIIVAHQTNSAFKVRTDDIVSMEGEEYKLQKLNSRRTIYGSRSWYKERDDYEYRLYAKQGLVNKIWGIINTETLVDDCDGDTVISASLVVGVKVNKQTVKNKTK